MVNIYIYNSLRDKKVVTLVLISIKRHSYVGKIEACLDQAFTLFLKTPAQTRAFLENKACLNKESK